MDRVLIKPKLMKEAKKELINKLKANIDAKQVVAAFKEHLGVRSIDQVKIQRGDIVSQDGIVAFKLDLACRLVVSVLVDEEGQFIGTYH